ncbi:MAG: sigma-70 family RNA polymerase sigma factor [Patescibacteria group bacterium]
MPVHAIHSSNEARCEISQKHLQIAEQIGWKFCRMQPDNRLHDDIRSAALRGLTLAYNHYNEADLTTGLIATCVNNAILNSLRRKANSGILPIEAESSQTIRADAWSETISTDEMVDLKRQRKLLARLLNGPLLNETQKRVIAMMTSEQEYSQREIAAVMGVQQPAVSKIYARAVERLREALQEPLKNAA